MAVLAAMQFLRRKAMGLQVSNNKSSEKSFPQWPFLQETKGQDKKTVTSQ
jgi:hypothetical protein